MLASATSDRQPFGAPTLLLYPSAAQKVSSLQSHTARKCLREWRLRWWKGMKESVQELRGKPEQQCRYRPEPTVRPIPNPLPPLSHSLIGMLSQRRRLRYTQSLGLVLTGCLLYGTRSLPFSTFKPTNAYCVPCWNLRLRHTPNSDLRRKVSGKLKRSKAHISTMVVDVALATHTSR